MVAIKGEILLWDIGTKEIDDWNRLSKL